MNYECGGGHRGKGRNDDWDRRHEQEGGRGGRGKGGKGGDRHKME